MTLSLTTLTDALAADPGLVDQVSAGKLRQGLAAALGANGLEYQLQPGEGAFYGPKIEFTLHDCIGRAWQCGTIQLDFSMPGRLGAYYIGEDGERKVPVMIHRAILGSLERFIGILIENYAGFLPSWIAPVQVKVLNITDNQADYVKQVVVRLKAAGIRVEADLRNEKIGFKIREHTLRRVPYLLVVGDKEMANGEVAVRTRRGKDLGVMSLESFSQQLLAEIDAKQIEIVEE